jgi:hypothetical protein
LSAIAIARAKIAAPALLCGVAVLCIGAAAAEVPAPASRGAATVTKKGAPRMTSLAVSLALDNPQSLAGESIPVTVTLRNAGTAPVSVHSPDSPSVFEYMLRPPAGAAVVLSARNARLARDPNPAPRLPEVRADLAPGAALEFKEDLASYAARPVPPGRYSLTVAYGDEASRAESAPVTLDITVPQVSRLATSWSTADSSLAAVFAHVPAQGGSIVFQRESLSQRPDDGTAYRRATIKPEVTGVASAVETADTAEPPTGRWLAWMHGGVLSAAVAQGATVFVSIDGTELGLREVSLHRTGWQPEVNQAMFVALGLGADGKPALAAATFSARERKGRVELVPLGIAALPQAWRARYRRDDSGAAALDLVMVERGGRLSRQTVHPQAKRAETPVPLFMLPAPLAAMDLAPVAGASPGSIDVLVGPHGDPPQVTFLRLALDGAAPLMNVAFGVPLDAAKRPPFDWALAAGAQPPVGVARFGDQIIGRRLTASGRGFVLEPKSASAAPVQLQVAGQDVWAVWVEPAAGLRYRKLPMP